jgi:hypothetical protein
MDKSKAAASANVADDHSVNPFRRREDNRGHVKLNEMKRTALTLLLPGGVSDRSAEVCLQSAFDEGCSAASLSALLHEAGKRAGEILQKVDHSVMGEVVQARDELFVGRDPILLLAPICTSQSVKYELRCRIMQYSLLTFGKKQVK